MSKSVQQNIKRHFDIFFGLSFLIIFSPVYIVTAIAIWIGDFHSPIYSQVRIGRNSKPFRFYKFRSMVVNADDILFKDPELYKKMRSGANKVQDDPRVTRVGKFIRKYSIDEFPQMINIIKGDMSVVGPRALRPDETKDFADRSVDNSRKLEILTSVKPGLTGLWQVSGRSKIDFDKRINLECEYALTCSLLKDFVILIKTPLAIIQAEGAY